MLLQNMILKLVATSVLIRQSEIMLVDVTTDL